MVNNTKCINNNNYLWCDIPPYQLYIYKYTHKVHANTPAVVKGAYLMSNISMTLFLFSEGAFSEGRNYFKGILLTRKRKIPSSLFHINTYSRPQKYF